MYAHKSAHFPAVLGAVAAIAAVFALGASAHAEQVGMDASSGAPQVVLRYAPSSLDSAAGTQTLYRRIVAAAEQVCPDAAGDSLHINAAVRACRAQAVAHAVQAIGNPRLAALHESHLKQG